jgi:hypothetical protein
LHSADYYREQAARARQHAAAQTTESTQKLLRRVAQDFDDIAEDLDIGAVEIRHPELLPQNRMRNGPAS